MVLVGTAHSADGLDMERAMVMESTVGGKQIRVDIPGDSTSDVLERVHDRLSQSCHFSRHWREILCDFEDGVLTLKGRLPSFYLKQVLQSIVRDVPGIERVRNQVDVVSAAGLSSVRRM